VPELDYYLVLDAAGSVEGLLVEEFVRDRDYSAAGLCGACWTPGEPRWRSAASFSRAVRTDRDLLARVVPAERAGAEVAFRQLADAELAPERELRAQFLDYEPFATAPPLRLGPADAPDGFRERRVYRVLFAKDPREDKDPREGQGPSGHRTVGGDHFTWTLRRVGAGLGWGLDVTALLATDADDAVGPVLRDLTAALRREGLVPVTTERFA
jgi:hypothetical protein